MTRAEAVEVARLLDRARAAHEIEDAKQSQAKPLPELTSEQIAAVDEMAGIA